MLNFKKPSRIIVIIAFVLAVVLSIAFAVNRVSNSEIAENGVGVGDSEIAENEIPSVLPIVVHDPPLTHIAALVSGSMSIDPEKMIQVAGNAGTYVIFDGSDEL